VRGNIHSPSLIRYRRQPLNASHEKYPRVTSPVGERSPCSLGHSLFLPDLSSCSYCVPCRNIVEEGLLSRVESLSLQLMQTVLKISNNLFRNALGLDNLVSTSSCGYPRQLSAVSYIVTWSTSETALQI
jgi:hypothetical protein